MLQSAPPTSMFPMTVTLTLQSIEQLQTLLPLLTPTEEQLTEAVNSAVAAVKSKAAPPAKTEKPAASQPTVEQDVAPEKKATPSATTQPAIVQDAEPAKAAVVSYADAAAAITKLSKLKGRDTAVAVLAKFGAAHLQDVKPEDFTAVIDASNEALGGGR